MSDAKIVVRPDDSVGMFERLAINPDVDVEKLERLIGMQERVMANEAKAAFTAAFVRLQGSLPEVHKRGRSHQGNYALFEDIQRAIRPVLDDHGFTLNYLTSFEDATIKVTAVLSHEDGHSQETSFVTRPDDSGKKNSIQAQGSAQSYGMRYSTLALLGITVTGMDDDGVGSEAPTPPDGYEDWLADMSSLADEGIAALEATWSKSNKIYQAHITKHQPGAWAKIKATAKKVG